MRREGLLCVEPSPSVVLLIRDTPRTGTQKSQRGGSGAFIFWLFTILLAVQINGMWSFSLSSAISSMSGRRGAHALRLSMGSGRSSLVPLFVKHIKPVFGFSRHTSHLYSTSEISSAAITMMSGINHQPEEVNLCHLTKPGSSIDPYWIEQLRLLDRPVARSLMSQLIPDNVLGYDSGGPNGPIARQGSLLDYTVQQKKKHPHKVILIRSGEFYETYGIDALMLIGYAGLNPMGNKCKAGCPAKNVQATLDSLTAQGLSVAVYEEIAEIVDNSRSKSKQGLSSAAASTTLSSSSKVKIKSRALTQIVSPAASTYVYDLCLRPDDIEFRENRPAVGIMKTTQGYLLCQIYLDEQSVVISERLTEEAVRSLLANSGAIDPIILQDCSPSLASSGGSTSRGTMGSTGELSFLAHNNHPMIKISGYDERDFPKQVLLKFARLLEMDEETILKQFRIVTNTQMTSDAPTSGTDGTVSSSTNPKRTRPRPIYTSTALQIGLLPNDNVPNLIPHLLPRVYTHNAISSRFLRKWILYPPPPSIADEMQSLCRILSTTKQSLPSFQAVSVGKVVSLLAAKQCNVALFRDIRKNVESLAMMLNVIVEGDREGGKKNGYYEDYSKIVRSVLAITGYESGLPAESKVLLPSCERIASLIEEVIAEEGCEDDDFSTHNTVTNKGWNGPRIPDDFFRRNEEDFRSKVSLHHPDIKELYSEIDNAVKHLCRVIEEEVPPGLELAFDVFENAIMIKEKPLPIPGTTSTTTNDIDTDSSITSSVNSIKRTTSRRTSTPSSNGDSTRSCYAIPGVEYIPYIDKKGKVMARRYTTDRLTKALNAYLDITSLAPIKVSSILQRLSHDLMTDLLSIVQSIHYAVILQTALGHTIAAKQKGWTLPTLVDSIHDLPIDPNAIPNSIRDDKIPLQVSGLIPYWISKENAIANSLTLQGLFLLTAPNMSGKSTLMRSLLISALLANCGLFIPVIHNNSIFPRFDTFFLRTASYDIPSEAKSAFALEMDDMRVVMRDCTNQSLVMIDELGKGTSARDGSALAGALLEYLDRKNVYGIFATHLHELFYLPLTLNNVIEKKMGFIQVKEEDPVKWTYQLEDGRCTDSMALTTARQYHIDEDVIVRAEKLLEDFDSYCRPNQDTNRVQAHHSDDVMETDESQPMEAITRDSTEQLQGRVLNTIPTRRFDFAEEMIPILQDIDESLHIVDIPVGHDPPASIEGQSAVYLLHVHPKKSKSSSGTSLGVFYVGETESLNQRLRQHRMFYKRNDCLVHCLAFNMPNKSMARALETKLITTLKSKGYSFDRDSDATHTLFSRA